ncbi:unnamed protein product [Lymnaea stagnalis]|uniref:Uncharacterized protein n=1 Tax=Lymnaea stagnalis TaxID=6523 RepID=A0AAV2I434_LYMST
MTLGDSLESVKIMLDIVIHFVSVCAIYIVARCHAMDFQSDYEVWEKKSLKDCSFLEDVSLRDENQFEVAPMTMVRLKLVPANRSLHVQWTQSKSSDDSKFQGDVFALTTPEFQDRPLSGQATCLAAKLQPLKSNDVSKLKSLKRKIVISLVQNVTSYVVDIGHIEGGTVIATRLLLQLPKMTQTRYCKSKQRSNSEFTDLLIPLGVHILKNRAEISITPPASSSPFSMVEVHLTLVTWSLQSANQVSQPDGELCKELRSEICFESNSEELISFDDKSTNPVVINLNKDLVYQLWADYILLENNIETCRALVKSPKFSQNSTGSSFDNVSRTDQVNDIRTVPVLDSGELGGDGSVNKTQRSVENPTPISAKVLADVDQSDKGNGITVIIGVTAGSLAALLAIVMGVTTCVCMKGKGYLRALRDEKTKFCLSDDSPQRSSSNIKILKDHMFPLIPTSDDKYSANAPPGDHGDDVKNTLLGIHQSTESYESHTSPRHSKSNSPDLSSPYNDGLCDTIVKTHNRDSCNSNGSVDKKIFTNSGLYFTHYSSGSKVAPRTGNSSGNMPSGIHSLRVSGVSRSCVSLEHVRNDYGGEVFASSIGESLLWSKRNLIGDHIVPPNSDAISLTSHELFQAFDGINEDYLDTVGAGNYYDMAGSSSQLWECATICDEMAC